MISIFIFEDEQFALGFFRFTESLVLGGELSGELDVALLFFLRALAASAGSDDHGAVWQKLVFVKGIEADSVAFELEETLSKIAE